jgi:hypothetical protein
MPTLVWILLGILVACLGVVAIAIWMDKRHPLNKRFQDFQGMDEDDIYGTPDHRKVG